jgi:hypothetical protein
MLLWQGSCLVHDEFKGIELDLLRAEYPDAKVLVHPESPANVVDQADVVGSTTQLINAAQTMDATHFIVATDNGILHKMRMAAPGKHFIEAPTAGNSATCKSCAHCPWMAMNGLQNLAEVLERGGQPDPRRSGNRPPGQGRDRPHARFRRREEGQGAADRRAGARKQTVYGNRTGMSNLHNRFIGAGTLDDKLQAAFEQNILAALLEDVGSGDLTGKLVPEAPRARARVIVREDAVLCGAPWFEGVMLAVDQDIEIDWQYAEGDLMAPAAWSAPSKARPARC